MKGFTVATVDAMRLMIPIAIGVNNAVFNPFLPRGYLGVLFGENP